MNFAASNFSFISLFFKADLVVKLVIIILIAASIYSWAIIIEKYKLFKRINGSSNFFEDQFWSQQALSGAIDKEMEIVEKKLTFLATVGSTTPFIGLFGTVWGIMNSFQSIAISKNTSLAIVAPGIAEALFATALGLLAAIPAVVAYNKFTSDSRKYSTRLENFSQSFISIT
ncbi:MAG: protein TolQ [Candidatus Fonsibacter ubiquis]|nr:protein TolQ [Candidatus Fonsibacter ubiquis]